MPTLTWLTRESDLHLAQKAPYRLLEPVADLSYGDQSTENMLIQGDNLDALKALLPYYAGKVKCIYIDPPYNTRSAFEHYDDNLEHSKWLAMIYPRLELLRELLSEEGSIWVSIDDNEGHYLKVIMDEVLGRSNFVANVVWQKRTSPDIRATLGAGHENIIVYAKRYDKFKTILKKLPKSSEQVSQYKNPDNDLRGPWVSSDYTAQGFRPNQMYTITTPSGKEFTPPEGTCWKNIESVYLQLVQDDRIWFGKNGSNMPRKKTFLNESEGQTAWTWWQNSEVGHTQESKKEIHTLFGAEDAFDTPKPERLLHRIIELATNPGDLVLDSFLGSATTAAVAHKMGRRYIGIELGEHAVTHCVPRLKKVVDGEQGGISQAVNWQSGGGFRFYRLGDPVFDDSGQINKSIKFPTLASHIWFCETKTPLQSKANSPLLGVHDEVAYYLLFNGILGDKRPDGGNVLTTKVLNDLPAFDGLKVIYGETSRLGAESLKAKHIIFKQIPYDIKAR